MAQCHLALQQKCCFKAKTSWTFLGLFLWIFWRAQKYPMRGQSFRTQNKDLFTGSWYHKTQCVSRRCIASFLEGRHWVDRITCKSRPKIVCGPSWDLLFLAIGDIREFGKEEFKTIRVSQRILSVFRLILFQIRTAFPLLFGGSTKPPPPKNTSVPLFPSHL